MKNIITIVLILTLVNCKESPKNEKSERQSFSISGTINGEYSDYIYLNYGKTKDSVKVINSAFQFSGSVKKPVQGWLNLKPDATVAWLYIENSDILITSEYQKSIQNEKPLNILKITNVKGSYSDKIQKEYIEFIQANKDKENFQSLLYNKLDTFLQKNKNHPFSGKVLGEIALINPVLTKNKLLELYSKIDTTQQNNNDLEMFKMGIANLDKYNIGRPFSKFELPNTNGKKIDISNYLGKITLVDFWASWCAPCRDKHPKLIELKKMFKNNNFDIVSISIDDNKENWLKAVEKDKLKWTNLIDENKEIENELGIPAIPFNYLIDEDGMILGVNLTIENIEKIVAKKASR